MAVCYQWPTARQWQIRFSVRGRYTRFGHHRMVLQISHDKIILPLSCASSYRRSPHVSVTQPKVRVTLVLFFLFWVVHDSIKVQLNFCFEKELGHTNHNLSQTQTKNKKPYVLLISSHHNPTHFVVNCTSSCCCRCHHL